MTTNERVARDLMQTVNCFCNAKEVAQNMTREHKTLQQTFTKVCVEWLKVLSTQPARDDRNKASVELAQSLLSIPEVKTLLDTTNLPMI